MQVASNPQKFKKNWSTSKRSQFGQFCIFFELKGLQKPRKLNKESANDVRLEPFHYIATYVKNSPSWFLNHRNIITGISLTDVLCSEKSLKAFEADWQKRSPKFPENPQIDFKQ